MPSVILQHLKLMQKDRMMTLEFDTHEIFQLSCYTLRIYSPSAEMRGHHQAEPNKETIAKIPENINIISIEPVGYYAIKIKFDDGHQTGIYDWNYLYHLCTRYGNQLRSFKKNS